MPLNAAETVIAANGGVSIAPYGTTLPTDATTTLDSAFKDLGYISEDGATFTPNVTSDGLPAWQSLTHIRKFITEFVISVAFEMLQWNEDTLTTFFGGGVFTDNGDGTFDFKLPKPGEAQEMSLVIDGVDGAKTYRIVLDKVFISDAGDVSFMRSDAAKLPVTVDALAGDDEGRPGAIYWSTPAA
jgi:hypothetical protein